MDLVAKTTALGDRRLVRRGLLAGFAGLGAAALTKFAGVGKAAAATGDPILVDGTASGSGITRLHAADATHAAMVVTHGSSSSGRALESGLQGVTTSNAGFASGLYGFSDLALRKTGGIGVVGDGGATGLGVVGRCFGGFGFNVQISRGGIGVEGEANTSTQIGTRGINISNGTGVVGVSNAGGSFTAEGNGSGIGVLGKSGSGVGVQGQSMSNYGVYGSSAGGGIGVFGLTTTGAGMWGQSVSYIGVVGYAANAVGVYGTGGAAGMLGESETGVGMWAHSKVANVEALHAESLVSGPGKIAARFIGDVLITGSYTATGGKSAVVPHPDGSMRTLYCTEATEAYFEDFGRGQLIGGVANVRLDSDFAPLVHATSYHIFITPEGECKGLSISQQNTNGFEVRELQGGKSSLAFSYRIVAKRRDMVSERLKRVDPETMKALRQQGPNAIANLVRPKAPQAVPPGFELPGGAGPITPTPPGNPQRP